MGSSDNTFGVISLEINLLSDEIAKAIRLIEDSIDAIRISLPGIMKQTTGQIAKLETFTETMLQLKNTVQQSMSMTDRAGTSNWIRY